jgi:hypothetical protein
MDMSEQREAMRSLVDLWARLEAITREQMPEASEAERASVVEAAAGRILRLP